MTINRKSSIANPQSPCPQFLAYHGHTYRVLYYGPTKFGKRAHLQFLDQSSDFWVDAKLTKRAQAPDLIPPPQPKNVVPFIPATLVRPQQEEIPL